MRHLGLDLSLRSTGIAVYDDDLPVADGILHVEVVGGDVLKDAPMSVHLGRMHSIASGIVRVAKQFDVKLVAIEGPAFGATTRLYHLGGLAFIVMSQLRLSSRLSAEVVPPLSARKVVLGRGSPPRGWAPSSGKALKGSARTKAWVAERLVERYGVDYGDDNKNDAVVMAIWSSKKSSGVL